MIKYAQSSQCRRSVILGYFGDAQAAGLHCKRCDNCAAASGDDPTREGGPIDTPAGHEVLLKVLSGVARAKGRFGKNAVAQMLTGSASEKMDRSGLKRLSTYGILNTFRQAELVQILDGLEGVGLLECPEVDRFRPIVNLTEEGCLRLRAKGPFDFSMSLSDELRKKVSRGGLERLTVPASRWSTPPSRSQSRTPAPIPTPKKHPPTRRFRTTRSGSGSARSDKNGRERRRYRLTSFFPTRSSMSSCGPDHELPRPWERSRASARHGSSATAPSCSPRSPAPQEQSLFLPPPPGERGRRVGGWRRPRRPRDSPPRNSSGWAARSPLPPHADPPPQGPQRQVATERSAPGAYVPTEEWTWRLLDRGFTLDEAAAIRGLLPTDIVRHATLAARRGKPLAPESFLKPEVLRRWNAWRSEHGNAAPPPSDSGPMDLWSLFVACR